MFGRVIVEKFKAENTDRQSAGRHCASHDCDIITLNMKAPGEFLRPGID